MKSITGAGIGGIGGITMPFISSLISSRAGLISPAGFGKFFNSPSSLAKSSAVIPSFVFSSVINVLISVTLSLPLDCPLSFVARSSNIAFICASNSVKSGLGTTIFIRSIASLISLNLFFRKPSSFVSALPSATGLKIAKILSSSVNFSVRRVWIPAKFIFFAGPAGPTGPSSPSSPSSPSAPSFPPLLPMLCIAPDKSAKPFSIIPFNNAKSATGCFNPSRSASILVNFVVTSAWKAGSSGSGPGIGGFIEFSLPPIAVKTASSSSNFVPIAP